MNAPIQSIMFDTAARYFLEVARTGSITLAAEQLHVASSAISRQISKLEETVGCALFERRARGMVLSSAGARLAAYVRSSALEGERVLEELRDPARQAERQIKIASTDGFACGFLSEVMLGFRQQHPGCSLSLLVGSPESVSGLVSRGDVDVGLKFSLAPERGVRIEHQQTSPIMAVMSAQHALASHKRLSLQEITQHTLGLPVQGSTLRQLLDMKFQAEGLRLTGSYSGNLATLLPLTLQGETLLFTSVISVSVLLTSGQLVAIPVPELDFQQRSVQVLTHDSEAPAPLQQAFVKHLVAAVVDHG